MTASDSQRPGSGSVAALSLLRLFPFEHRDLFEEEINTVFEQGLDQARNRGRASAAWFLVRELASLTVMAWTERRLQRRQRGAYLSNVLPRQESLRLSVQEGRSGCAC